jgi:hypothetical protein
MTKMSALNWRPSHTTPAHTRKARPWATTKPLGPNRRMERAVEMRPPSSGSTGIRFTTVQKKLATISRVRKSSTAGGWPATSFRAPQAATPSPRPKSGPARVSSTSRCQGMGPGALGWVWPPSQTRAMLGR